MTEQQIRNIKNTREFNRKYRKFDDKILKSKYLNEKFNITLKDVKDIFKVNLIPITNIEMIIEPHYLPGLKDINIQMMHEQEVESIFRKNMREGIYSSVGYIRNLYSEYKPNSNVSFFKELDNIECYKIYQSSENKKQLINFIKDNIKKEIL